ncbi:MAG: phage portal protein [Agathobacter sp.]
MGLFDFLGKWIGKVKIGSSQTVVIDIPPSLFYKELALYTAESLIANAISLSEFRVYENHVPVKNKDYYLLNIAPNKNENSNYFWHRVIKKMIREPTGAMVVEVNGELHCAEYFSIKQERPIRGNLYDGVVLEGGLQLNKVFSAQEVYHFRMEDVPAKTLIDGVHEDYGTLLKAAARAFKDTNGRKFKFKVDSLKAGDEEFATEFKNTIANQIKAYMENEYATYVEYEGEELVEESQNKSAKSIDDFVKLRQDMFQMVAQALKIPQSLMAGNITSLKEVSDVFLTFAVDPYADCITATLNKRATAEEYCKGNYYECYTGTVKHKDIFDLAPSVDKLIASGVACTDEARVEIGWKPLNKPWSKRHVRTKNYEDVELNAKEVEKEGEE